MRIEHVDREHGLLSLESPAASPWGALGSQSLHTGVGRGGGPAPQPRGERLTVLTDESDGTAPCVTGPPLAEGNRLCKYSAVRRRGTVTNVVQGCSRDSLPSKDSHGHRHCLHPSPFLSHVPSRQQAHHGVSEPAQQPHQGDPHPSTVRPPATAG